jgi:hypothetical protein
MSFVIALSQPLLTISASSLSMPFLNTTITKQSVTIFIGVVFLIANFIKNPVQSEIKKLERLKKIALYAIDFASSRQAKLQKREKLISKFNYCS